MQTVLVLALWSAAVTWTLLLMVVLALRRFRHAPRPTDADPMEEPEDAPLVSILVPARNEEHRILRQSLASMLAQNYPAIEVIVVNDRSTDRTLEILREVAESDSRLRVIDGEEPPPGWRGKPFALQQALAHARGEWILSIDADILLDPETVRKALALARKYRCDALSLLPRMDYVSFWDHVIEPQALNLLRLGMLIGSVKARLRWACEGGATHAPAAHADHKKQGISFNPLFFLSAYVGDQAFTIGAFTLVRRRALDAIGGYAAIRSEVMDETILGIRLHQQGFRVFAVEGTHLIHTPARVAFSELWEAYSRVICPAVGRNPLVLMASVATAAILTLLPVGVLIATFLGMIPTDRDMAAVIGSAALGYLAMVAVGAILAEEDRQPGIYHLASFVGFAVFIAIALSSVWRRYKQRDVIWKGRPVFLQGMAEPGQIAQHERQG